MKALAALAFSLLTAWTGIARAEVIRGTVLEDHSGAALPSAAVRLKTISGVTLKEMETDRSGAFEFSDMAPGIYQVGITKTNYASLNARMVAADVSAATPVMRLIKYGVISGRITSPRNGGTVVVIERVPQNQIPRSYSGMVNSAGEFRIFGIPPGRYVLASPLTSANTIPGIARGLALYPANGNPREFAIVGGEQYDVNDFVVQPGGSSAISGTISSPAGPQIYTLTMVPTEYPSIRVQITLTAMDGTFKLDNIQPGQYDLYASGPVMPPSFFAHLHLDLHSQNVENMDIRLQPGRTVAFILPPGKLHPDCSSDGTITLQSLGSWPLVRDQKMTVHLSPQAEATRIENVGPTLFAITAQSTTGGCTGITERLLDMTGAVPSPHVIMGFRPPGVIHGAAPAGAVVILRDVTPGREAPVQAVFPISPEFRFDGLAPGQYCIAKSSATDSILHWIPESGCGSPVVDLAPGESKGL